MAPSLRFSSLVLLTMSWMLAAGCGDDDTTTLASGGSSGSSGHAATAGTSGAHAGSSGMHPSAAGAAGAAGSGASGSSGTDAGGAAGEGGELTSTGATSGGATSGGATSGGTGGATAGTGGTGGATAGTGGTAGAANSVKNCAYQCATDDDCKVNGTDQGFSCNPISKRCEDVSACQVSSDCVAFANQFNWYVPCADDTGCSGTEACVAVGGGLCAPLPDPQTGCADGVLTQLAHFGATGNVQVCATPGVCVNKTCQVSCVDPINGACSNDGTQCNTGTGLCECSASTECMVAGKPVCGADSHCGC
ncbi:MAG TPA: hypothetical protein VGF76_25010, partial [Polyangiaceae bacterium]